jgi:hypothetical protein
LSAIRSPHRHAAKLARHYPVTLLSLLFLFSFLVRIEICAQVSHTALRACFYAIVPLALGLCRVMAKHPSETVRPNKCSHFTGALTLMLSQLRSSSQMKGSQTTVQWEVTSCVLASPPGSFCHYRNRNKASSPGSFYRYRNRNKASSPGSFYHNQPQHPDLGQRSEATEF